MLLMVALRFWEVKDPYVRMHPYVDDDLYGDNDELGDEKDEEECKEK